MDNPASDDALAPDLQLLVEQYVDALHGDPASPVIGGGPGWHEGEPCIELLVDKYTDWHAPAAPNDMTVIVIVDDDEAVEMSPGPIGDAVDRALALIDEEHRD